MGIFIPVIRRFLHGAIYLGWCDLERYCNTPGHTDTRTHDKTMSPKPTLPFLPGLLIFTHHFRLSQSSDP